MLAIPTLLGLPSAVRQLTYKPVYITKNTIRKLNVLQYLSKRNKPLSLFVPSVHQGMKRKNKYIYQDKILVKPWVAENLPCESAQALKVMSS